MCRHSMHLAYFYTNNKNYIKPQPCLHSQKRGERRCRLYAKVGMADLKLNWKYKVIPPVVLVGLFAYAGYIFCISDENQAFLLHQTFFRSLVLLIPGVAAIVGLFLTYISIRNQLIASSKNIESQLRISSETIENQLKIASDAIESHEKSARQSATINLVMEFNADKRLQQTKNFIFQKAQERNAHNMNDNALIKYYLELTDEINSSESDSANKELITEAKKDDIHYVLNRYEFAALGIRIGAFDEQLFKNLHCSSFLKLWKHAEPLIACIRNSAKENNTMIKDEKSIFQEIEYLAKKWKDSPIALINESA